MRISRLLLITLLFSLLIFIFHAMFYGFIFTKGTELSIANSMFIVGILIFFPTFALRIGSANLFLGLRYSLYRLINADKLKEYNSMSEFTEGKIVTPKGDAITDILIISFILVIVSYLVALNWSP